MNELNLVSVGCWYVPEGSDDTSFSNFGEFTDFQLFGRVLADEEMEAITGCDAWLAVNIISWDAEEWHLKKQSIRNIWSLRSMSVGRNTTTFC